MKTQAELAAEQAAFWNGQGAKTWLASYERIERTVTPFGQAGLVAAAVQAGERIVDIGCGTGGTTAELARLAGPKGHVLGVDISEALIAVARQQGLPNATFAVADATIHPFEPAAYDLLFSRFGVMFFADPVAAFRNLHRALKPTGRLTFVCWRTAQENPWGLVPFRAAAPHLPPMERPGPEDPGQYSFGDRARVERVLAQVGFGAPSFQPIDRPIRLGKDIAETVDSLGRFGPLARLFAEATSDQADKARRAIADALKPFESAQGVMLAGACWHVSAAAR